VNNMDYSKYENAIENFEKEIRQVEKNTSLSKRKKEKKLTFLKEQHKNLQKHLETLKKVEKAMDEIRDNRELSIDDRRKQLREKEVEIIRENEDFNKKSHGKFRTVASALIGQLDKKIHNAVYNKFNNGIWHNLSDKLWNMKYLRVGKRYDNLPGYVGKNILIALGVLGVTAVVPFLSVASPVIVSLVGAFTANTVFKTISTIYHQRKYGGHLLKRKYDIRDGKYRENIKDAIYEYQLSRGLSKDEVIEQKVVK